MDLQPKPPVDTSKPHSARVYDYLLRGKDHYKVDVELAEQLPAWFRVAAQHNRAFMQRAVAWLARRGVDQFLDIGTGIPTEPNLHQIVQGINPLARIAYADNDPIVLAHAEALLISTREGATDYIEADARDPAAILNHARTFLDFERPIALSLIALMHFILDTQDPYGIVRTLVDALPAGSYLVLSHTSVENLSEQEQQASSVYGSSISSQSRTREQITRFFDGLTFEGPGLEPSVVYAPEWFMDEVTPKQESSAVYAGVARKR